MEYAEETGAPSTWKIEQHLLRLVADRKSRRTTKFGSLSMFNVAHKLGHNSSIRIIDWLSTSLKDSLSLPKDSDQEFERVILMILDQEPVENLIRTVTTKLSSTEKVTLINLLYDVDIFFALLFIILAYDPFPDAST